MLYPLLAIVLLLLLKKRAAALKAIAATAFVVAIYLSLRLSAEHNPPPAMEAPPPLALRPIVVARAFAEYTGLILLPVHLHMDRSVEALPGSSACRCCVSKSAEPAFVADIVVASFPWSRAGLIAPV